MNASPRLYNDNERMIVMTVVGLRVICTMGSCPQIKEVLEDNKWIVKKNTPYYYDYIAEKDIDRHAATIFAKKLIADYPKSIIEVKVIPSLLIS